VHRVKLVLRAFRVLRVIRGTLDHRVSRGRLVPLERRVNKGFRGKRVPRVRKAHRVCKVKQGPRAQQAYKVSKVFKVSKVTLVIQVHRDLKGFRVKRG
jgi:hypothetical protein